MTVNLMRKLPVKVVKEALKVQDELNVPYIDLFYNDAFKHLEDFIKKYHNFKVVLGVHKNKKILTLYWLGEVPAVNVFSVVYPKQFKWLDDWYAQLDSNFKGVENVVQK
jgi:hypothetical protein